MRERLINYIRRHELMRPGNRAAVAVSGGADSVALLRLLLEARGELGIVLSVVHFNHQIRGAEADADEKFVRALAQGFDLEFYVDSADTPAYARTHKMSLEAAGRKLRYAFFGRLLAPGSGLQALDRVATAHTRDDQAETVLLRFLRGAGTRGLAGIYPKLPVASCQFPATAIKNDPAVVRPLLEITRAELRSYLEQQSQPWREDASNRDVSFARNRLRHELMPLLMRDCNPALAEVLSDMAEIARAEEAHWEEQVRCLLSKLLTQSAIQLDWLEEQPLALQRRLVRALAEQHGLRLEFHHVEEVLAMARSITPARASAVQARVELPHHWEAVRRGRELWFRSRCQESEQPATYDLALPVGCEVEVAGRRIRATLLRSEELADGSETRATQIDTHALLDPKLAEQRLRVRNWRAGDRYWPAHTKQPKKLKELLQARHIPRAQKTYWPVVVSPTSAKPGQMWGTCTCEASAEEIVWVPGFAAPERFRAREEGETALLLEVLPVVPNGTKVQGA